MATNPPPAASTSGLQALLPTAISLAAAAGAAIGFLLVASVNGNATASADLTNLTAWLTGAWPQLALYALLIAVPSPLGADVLTALKGGATSPVAHDLAPLATAEARALNLPIQVDSGQAEAAINHLLSALLDAHSSTDSLTSKLEAAADKAAHASILSLPPMQPIDTSSLRQMTASSNETPPAPAGPLSAPAS